MAGEKHINKIPPKSRDNPMRSLFMCFFFVGFFAHKLGPCLGVASVIPNSAKDHRSEPAL